MNIKLSKLILPTIAIGALLMTTFHSVAMANPVGHCDTKHVSSERMHEHMKARLNKLAERLEIKSSQQAAWEEYAKSVETLTEQHEKKPSADADAATISRYRAERATEFTNKLTRIADATTKLQTALTEDQRKILNQASHHFLHKDHGWKHKDHEGHMRGQHEGSDMKGHHDAH